MNALFRTFSRRRRADRGQSLVELALVAPIFFLLVFSVIQLGLVFGTQNGLVNGAREAARRAATYRINESSDDDAAVWATICTTVENEIRQLGDRVIPAYDDARLDPDLVYEWERNPEGDEYFVVAHVTATYAHPLYVPLVSAFLDRADGTADDQLTLVAEERMRIENPALEFTGTPGAMATCP